MDITETLKYKGFLAVLFISTVVKATVYEDGDSNISSWGIYGKSLSSEEMIQSHVDSKKGSVVSLIGDRLNTGFILGGQINTSQSWNNSNEKILKWSMKYDENFLIFIRIKTEKGKRYLIYAPGELSYNRLHGLGKDALNGEWHTYSRDLEKDLSISDPDNRLIAVTGFMIRGSGLISHIELSKDDDTLVKSKYEKEFLLARCDENNPEVQFINRNEDWEYINDEDKTIFCVSPGDYTASSITNDRKQIIITQSGTEDKPRQIILNNGNNLHPSKLQRDQLAKYLLLFQNANHWIVDRQSFWDTTNPFHRNVLKKSSYNVFSRGYFMDTACNFSIGTGSVDNTIQRNHMEKGQWSVDTKKFYDTAAINLTASDEGEFVTNTVIANNEIINYVDGIQTVRKDNAEKAGIEVDFSGTIIDTNLIYVTNIMYTDCKGNSDKNIDMKDPNSCSYTENALDFKAGANNSNNPMIVTNNIMWGFLKSERTGTKLANSGAAVVTHYDIRNVIFKNNLLFNSRHGFVSGSPLGTRYPIEDSVIENNIFSNMSGHSIFIFGKGVEGVYNGGKNVKIANNVFMHNFGYSAFRITNTENFTIENNIFSYIPSIKPAMWFGSTLVKYYSSNLTIKENKFYNVNARIPDFADAYDNERISEDLNTSKYQREFTIRKFTSTPSQYHFLP